MHSNCDDDAVGRLSQEPHFLGHDPPAVDDDPAADPLELLWVRPVPGQDLVFLGQPIAWVHDAVGDIAIVREEEEALGVAVQPAHRKHPLRHTDQIHHRPAITLVLDGCDVAGRLVQDQVAQRLRADDAVVDADLVPPGIGLGAELGHDRAVDRNAALPDQFFCGSARCHPARCEDALQAFHLGASLICRNASGRSADARQSGPLRRRIARGRHRSSPDPAVTARAGTGFPSARPGRRGCRNRP